MIVPQRQDIYAIVPIKFAQGECWTNFYCTNSSSDRHDYMEW